MFDKDIFKASRILFVEDEDSIRSITTKILSELVKEVVEASDGVEGLEKFKNSISSDNKNDRFDLIITDLSMPNLDGFGMISAIRELDKVIPIIIVTAHGDTEFITKAVDLGIAGYSIKPLSIAKLIETMNRVLEPGYLRKNLEKKVEEQTAQIRSILDLQENIVILTDGDVKFANKKLFDFLGYTDLEEFSRRHTSISEFFVENEMYYYLGKIDSSATNWVDEIQSIPIHQRVVAMIGKDFHVHAFTVSINSFDSETKIVNFTNITESMLENIKLHEKTIYDKLTGANNREYFEQNYKKLIKECKKSNNLFALAVLDIDHFKRVNDTFGHSVGDDVLKKFVEVIHKNSRTEDILIRWGGEEFILILKVKSEESLLEVLEKLRNYIENEKFDIVDKITCSIGSTVYTNDENISETINRADEAVYEAKNNGRNQVVYKS